MASNEQGGPYGPRPVLIDETPRRRIGAPVPSVRPIPTGGKGSGPSGGNGGQSDGGSGGSQGGAG